MIIYRVCKKGIQSQSMAMISSHIAVDHDLRDYQGAKYFHYHGMATTVANEMDANIKNLGLAKSWGVCIDEIEVDERLNVRPSGSAND